MISPVTESPVADLLTVGHGTAGEDELLRLLHGAGVRLVVDVRRFPGSRRHPHVTRAQLERWLPVGGVQYRWDPRLGGRRHVPAGDDEVDTWWQVPAFRAYAAHMRTDEFRAGLDELLTDVAARSAGYTAAMCSESLWWRCHRRFDRRRGGGVARTRRRAPRSRRADRPPPAVRRRSPHRRGRPALRRVAVNLLPAC